MPCCGQRSRETSPDDPIVLGDEDGTSAVRARINVRAYGLRTYDVGWFTGDGVDAAIEARTITPV